MEDWQIDALLEVRMQLAEDNLLIQQGVRYVEFVSRSNGKGRNPRKKWREVRLVTHRGKTVQLGKRLSKKIEFLLKDVFPEGMDYSNSGDWLEAFINALREANELLGK
jgi:hypothetical protein